MATDTWTNSGVANWNTAADWSGGVPTSTSDVVVAQGDPQVTAAISINSLTLTTPAEVDFINAGSSTIAGAVNNSGYVTLDAASKNGGSNLSIGGVLTNTGVFQLGATDNSLSKSDTVTVAGIVNHSGSFIGDLEVAGGSSSAATMLVNDSGAAGFGAAGVLYGIVHLSGFSTIEFASGQITTIAANSALDLNGKNALVADAGSLTTNSALSGLALNAGSINFDNGAVVTTSGAFTNLGSLEVSSVSKGPLSSLTVGGNLLNVGNVSVEAGSVGGSSLTINGVLTNHGTFDAGGTNATRTTTIQTNGLVNTGYISMASSPTSAFRTLLYVKAAAGFGTAGVLTGTVQLSGYAGITFTSGQISTIQGSLSLTDATAFLNTGGAAPGANSALKGLKTITGSLNLDAGAGVTTTGALANSGIINLDSGYYGYYGAGSTGGGSSLTIGGVLTNASTLNIGNSDLLGADTLTATGVVNRGSINVSGNIYAPIQVLLNVTSGAAGFGTAGVVSGQVNVSGDAEIEFASGQISSIQSGATLSLDGPSAFVADAGALTSNSALVGLTANSGVINLNDGASVTTTAGLINSGSLSLDGSGTAGGSSLKVGGVLTNSSNLDIGYSYNLITQSDTIAATGLANTGSINLFGGATSAAEALINISGAAGFGAAGVLSGRVSLSGDSMIEFASGQISGIASGASLTLNGPNALIADAAALTSNSALTGLASNSGTLELDNGAAVTTTAGLTNSGALSLDGNGTAGGSSLKIGGVLTNSTGANGIVIGNSSMTASDTVTATGITNGGMLALAGGASSAAEALLNLSGAAGFGTAGVISGQVRLSGHSMIEFGSGQISGIASGSSLSLNGPGAFIADAGALTSSSALKGLASNSGTLELDNGAAVTTTGGLTNTGTISLDPYSYSYYFVNAGGSSLAVGGVLTNQGSLDVGNAYGYGNPITLSDKVTATAIANSGTIDLAGGASSSAEALINISGAAGFGTAGKLSGTVTLSGNSMIEFASGQISSVTGGASLTLNGPNALIADAGSLSSNSALAGLATNSGTINLENGVNVATTVGLTNSGALYLDTNGGGGGSSLKVGGVLTNSSTLDIGYSYSPLTQSATVTATGISNSGTINLFGGASSAAEALLNLSGAAGFGTAGTLTGTVNLSGDSMIEFASGQISSVASGASLTLNGPNALIADAGSPASNSALAGLATNSGTINLENGVIVATTVGLTNSGSLSLAGGGSSLNVGGVLSNSSAMNLNNGAKVTTTAGLTNSGSLYLDTSYGDVGGSGLKVGGVLTNSSNLDIGYLYSPITQSDTVTATGLSNSGTIDLYGGASSSAEALINISGAAGFGTAGKLTGTVSLSGDSMIEFGSGQITSISGASLSLNGPNALIADAGSLASNSALAGLATNSGTITLENGVNVATTVGLTNSGGLYLDTNGGGGSSLKVGGALTNQGTLGVGNTSGYGAPITLSDTVAATAIANSGTIDLAGGASSAAEALLNLSGAAGFGTAGWLSGTVDLSGHSMIEFGSGQISSIASGASLTLSGPNALIADAGSLSSNSALAGLATNSGNMELDQGSVTTTGGLTNSGTLYLDRDGGGGSSLKVGGVLTNSNTIGSGYGYSSGAQSPTTIAAIGGIVNNSSIYNNGGDQIIGSAVTGTGSFTLYGYGSTLAMTEFDSSVGSGQNVSFDNYPGEIVFGAGAAQGFAATINGWSANDLIDVKGFGTGTTESFASNVLTLTDGSKVAHLTFSGANASQFSLTNTATDSIVKFV